MKPIKLAQTDYQNLYPGDIIQKRLERKPVILNIEEGYEFTVLSNDKVNNTLLVSRTVRGREHKKHIDYEGIGVEGITPSGDFYFRDAAGSNYTISYWIVKRSGEVFLKRFTENIMKLSLLAMFLYFLMLMFKQFVLNKIK